ncbi:MAG: sulfatase-like hydrolase/transferase, partial [Phycisphaerales bacterium]|nr:sulfatase-like hydrolase/transferase [Phycisphaerales bacterium]
VSMNPPHTPYSQVPAKYKKAYEGKTDRELINRDNVNLDKKSYGGKIALGSMKNYFSMVTGVDEQFGRIVKALSDAGLDKNTIVLFTSDHGNCLGSHDKPTKNNHYEESMRVPFMIRWPGKIRPRKDDLLMSTPDIYPTLLDLMGFSNATPKNLQGASRAELFRTGKGERPKSQLYFWMPVEDPAGGRRGLRNHRYTLEITRQKDKPEQIVLHDNEKDPFQLKNAAKKLPDVVAKLTKEMNARLKEINDPWLGG